jgi:acylpyruvate hydrolase
VLLDLSAASPELPADIIQFIDGGRALIESAQRVVRSYAGQDSRLLHGLEEVTFLPPVPRPGKIISLGVNYPSHGQEAAHLESVRHLMSGPPVPRAFAKLPSVLVGHRQPILYPQATRQLDYEIELAFVIGGRCKDVPAARCSEVVYGYTIYNDLSMRDVQKAEMESGLLLLGKNFDTAGAMGPWLVTADEVPDPHNLDLTLTVNGEVRQHDSTRNMINRIPAIVQYWSQITLEAGDVISTGTPAGVAIFRDPPGRYLLQPGDRIAATISGLGTLENAVQQAA